MRHAIVNKGPVQGDELTFRGAGKFYNKVIIFFDNTKFETMEVALLV